jgi:hypothetical protein
LDISLSSLQRGDALKAPSRVAESLEEVHEAGFDILAAMVRQQRPVVRGHGRNAGDHR